MDNNKTAFVGFWGGREGVERILSAKRANTLTGVTQFRLRFARDDNDDKGADCLKFFSGNAALWARPQLIIEYYVP
ncbi:MAG: hypothetical protein AB1846_13910 [Chloroflexota bacterium]